MTAAKPDSAEATLVIPRRLAIALLAEAQKADGAEVHGVIGARDGAPQSVCPGDAGADQLRERGETLWGRYRSGATTPDARGGRQLLISIDTKGVLQLRCWEGEGAQPVERALRIL